MVPFYHLSISLVRDANAQPDCFPVKSDPNNPFLVSKGAERGIFSFIFSRSAKNEKTKFRNIEAGAGSIGGGKGSYSRGKCSLILKRARKASEEDAAPCRAANAQTHRNRAMNAPEQ
ncbi:MAG: hypothetical protein ACREOZ_00865 [Gloeomargaritales cyanobacterium]